MILLARGAKQVSKGVGDRQAWEARLAGLDSAVRDEFNRVMSGLYQRVGKAQFRRSKPNSLPRHRVRRHGFRQVPCLKN